MRHSLCLLCLFVCMTGTSFGREVALSSAGRAASPVRAGERSVQQTAPQERLAYRRSFDVAAFEELVFECVNEERRRHGLRPFSRDAALWKAARAHSSDMAGRNFFSHDTPRGFFRKGRFGDRLRANGVVAPRMAENIAMLPLVRSRAVLRRRDPGGQMITEVQEDRLSYAALAAWAVQQWMESPGHRKNILSPALTTMGIGAAVGLRGQEEYVYLTQDFGGN